MTDPDAVDTDAAVRGYAAEVAGCSLDRIRAVSRFEDGNRHAVYKVIWLNEADAEKALVVRVSYGGGPAELEQAEHEAAVLATSGGVSAPLLYDFRATSLWFDAPAMCLQFITGHQKDLNTATPEEIGRLGSVVAAVHALPVDGLSDRNTPDDLRSYAAGRLQSILATLAWARDPLPAVVQADLRTAADSVEQSLAAAWLGGSFDSDKGLALLHGDIGPGNTLWGPDPVLIDWEYARLGDPADEIAYTLDQNGLTTAQRAAFWRGYASLGSPDQLADVVERATWWEPVTLLGSTLWWVERWVKRAEADITGKLDPDAPREADYYLGHVISRLHRLRGLLGPP